MNRRHLRVWASTLCLTLLLPCLLFLSGCRTDPVERNAMTAVTLDGGTITIEASLTDGFLGDYTEKSVYLFELPSHYSVDVDLTELNPVADTKPKAHIRFELPVTDGARSRLYASYLVASYDPATKRYTALTTPMALQNPKAFHTANPPAEFVSSGSIKGLANAIPADAIRLGVSHAVVDVSIGDLMLPAWEEDAEAYVWNGTTAYLDGEALAALDEAVNAYTAAGVQVYLRFVLTGQKSPNNGQITANANRGATVAQPLKTGDENDGFSSLPPQSLAIPGAAADAQGYAVDMSSDSVATRMEGFFDALATRYTGVPNTPTIAFIIGYRVNNAATYANAGDMSLDAYVTNYEKLVRVAHTALRSHAADGRVYISLDDHRTATGMEGGWDAPLFLSAFAEEAALRGDFDWHIAAELYAASGRIWEENTAAEADRFTVRNLSTLTDLVGASSYHTPSGETRRLLVSGLAIPAHGSDEADTDAASGDQAASYAYAYLTARHNSGVEALIYSAYTDATAPACGLWTMQNGLPATQRPIAEVLKKIDTSAASTLSGGLTSLIGAPYTKLESAMAGVSEPITLMEENGRLDAFSSIPENAAPLFAFDTGLTHDFTGLDDLCYLELADAETLGHPVLHAEFDRATVNTPMTLTVTVPATSLIGGRELFMDLYAGELTDGTTDQTSPSLTLSLSRPATGDSTAGDGTILYEATVEGVRHATWQTASFPIEDFTERLSADDQVTLTLRLDAPTGSTYELGISEMAVTGTTAGADVAISLVIVLTVLAAMAVVFTVIVLYVRHKRMMGADS